MALRKQERQYWQERLNDLKESHERELKEARRTLDALAEQIEYLRSQLARYAPPMPGTQGFNPTAQQPLMLSDSQPYMSEEEADIRDLHADGFLDATELELALEQIGFANSKIEMEVSGAES